MSEKNDKHHAILVLGMHRSGTSAVTRVLNLLGADLGSDLLAAQADNPNGFWEHTRIVDIHERLLTALGRTWHDIREMPDGWLDHPASHVAIEEIAGFITEEFRDSPLWAVKDPRMCRFVPLWLRALDHMGIRASALIVVRDPREVAQSLHVRDGWTPARSYPMWAQHLLESYRATDGVSRAMVSYDDLMSDAAGTMARAGAAMGLSWPRPDADSRADIEAFINPGDRHHHARAESPGANDGDEPPLLRELFRTSCEVAAGRADWHALADLDRQYVQSASLFSQLINELFPERNEWERLARERMDHIHNLTQLKQTIEARRDELEVIALDRLGHIRLLEEIRQKDAHQFNELEAKWRAADAATSEALSTLKDEQARLEDLMVTHVGTMAELASAQERLARANDLVIRRRWLARQALRRTLRPSAGAPDTF